MQTFILLCEQMFCRLSLIFSKLLQIIFTTRKKKHRLFRIKVLNLKKKNSLKIDKNFFLKIEKKKDQTKEKAFDDKIRSNKKLCF